MITAIYQYTYNIIRTGTVINKNKLIVVIRSKIVNSLYDNPLL